MQNFKQNEVFNNLLSIIASDRFLNKQGLGNEVPFFICPYPVDNSVTMEIIKNNLILQLNQKNVQILDINLYDTAIEILRREGDLDYFFANEEKLSKKKLLDSLQSILDIETEMIPLITKKMKESDFKVLFISGAGEVFPYIRSHTILNNLQSKAKEKPTVMFFPGNYVFVPEFGSTLELFGRLKGDKYYRAFNINHYEL